MTADSPDIVASENQRLKHEVIALRARVAALESSRWWRLHPRLALSRLRPPWRQEEVTPVAPQRPRPVPSDQQTARFREEVVDRGSFSEDWFTVHIPAWEPVLQELQGRSAEILELGSFEGLSACYLLWRLNDARITCVDTFVGLPEYRAYGIAAARMEDAFDRNVALVDASRVRKLVGHTRRVLPELVDGERRFDLVYVDASHRALDVLVDVALVWQLLAPGGVTIFDDYGPIPPGEDALDHPTPAIDAFLSVVSGRYEVLDDGRQLIVRKTA
jgi:predicted O-methyltransferase YrrM